MKPKKNYIILISILILVSCGKDDSPNNQVEENNAPSITAQGFSVKENISDTDTIGTVRAYDSDEDALTFSITQNDNDLFEITPNGNLSLSNGKNLTFDVQSYSIIVSVSDGTTSSSATISITVSEKDNSVPVIVTEGFEVEETILDSQEIGTVEATDEDGDALTFSIVENDNGLFEISASGELSLANGKVLNFKTSNTHNITISVSDSKVTTTRSIAINVIDVNPAPEIINQEFTIGENISEIHIIGIVKATDEENEPLSFKIENQNTELFEINDNGELKLKPQQSLEVETDTNMALTISVSDGNEKSEAQIMLHIINITKNTFIQDSDAFITKWNIEESNDEIFITTSGGEFDYIIDWGDGTIESLISGNPKHTYNYSGIYTIAIKLRFPSILLANSPDREKIISIEQWGTIPWEFLGRSFSGCSNLQYNASDSPDLSKVSFLNQMFSGAISFNGNLNKWDVSTIKNFYATFSGAKSFNGDISNWNVSKAETMAYMFNNAQSFNADISNWNVSQVTVFQDMLNGASEFNQNLGGWNLNQNLKTAYNMLNNSGLSATNYGKTLIGWSQQQNIPEELTLGAYGLNFCSNDHTVVDAKDSLTNQHAWVIQGDTGIDCN